MLGLKENKITEDQINFEARHLHEAYLQARIKLGYHWYEKHINPYEVAPRRRDDGYTMCDFCDMKHLPWEKLDLASKQDLARKVELFHESQRAWDERDR